MPTAAACAPTRTCRALPGTTRTVARATSGKLSPESPRALADKMCGRAPIAYGMARHTFASKRALTPHLNAPLLRKPGRFQLLGHVFFPEHVRHRIVMGDHQALRLRRGSRWGTTSRTGIRLGEKATGISRCTGVMVPTRKGMCLRSLPERGEFVRGRGSVLANVRLGKERSRGPLAGGRNGSSILSNEAA